MGKYSKKALLFVNRHRSLFLHAGMGILLIILLVFFFRSPLASWYLQNRVKQFNATHHAILKIKKVRILGLASVRITGITLKPEQGDTMLAIDTAYASIGILKLITGRLSIHDVELIHTRVLYTEGADALSNWQLLFSDKRAGVTTDSAVAPADTIAVKSESARVKIDYAQNARRMLDFVFDKIPLRLEMRNFNLKYISNGHVIDWNIDRLDLRDHFFRTVIRIREGSTVTGWVLAGMVDNRERKADFRIYRYKATPAAGSGSMSSFKTSVSASATDKVPFLEYRWQAGVSFDTLSFAIEGHTNDEEQMILSGFAAVTGLTLDHRQVAAIPVHFERLSVDYRLLIGKDHLEVDSSTRVTFNRIDLHPYLFYRPYPSKRIAVSIHKPWFTAQDLFSSFPAGLFTTLDGLAVKGKLAWHLDFDVDLSNPDSLYFDTSLDRQQFSVSSYGTSNLMRINEPFLYTAYEHGEPVRTFMVGPENPDFRSLERISPYLRSAVMTSEDGGFYGHRGFLPDAFRESIVTNIKERRFARGGSTISMQLVKNVYLSRNKTIARKLEEALIVWLIENQGLATKDRMFEVYLNIIEWGPLIYGAQEASRFYFNKDASRLTLAEAIFLASIIPRPKSFRWSFDDRGHLRESNAGYYRLVSEKMLLKGWITTADAEKLIPDVELRGPAKLLLKKTDPSFPADSVPPEIED